jgi:hypothetical protein
MKLRIRSLFILAFLSSCSNELSFDSKEFRQKSTLLCDKNCTEIKIEIPYATANSIAADSINRKVFQVIKDLVYVNETPIPENDYEALVASFISSFESTKEAFPEAAFGWDAKIVGEVVYQTDKIINIEISHYTFTGGAHGFEGKQSLLFNSKTGKVIQIRNLFQKYDEFKDTVEILFRKKYKIPAKGDINQTGYLFEDAKFQLPKNIFFTTDGLLLHYNQYEVAPYAEGPKTLFLPYTAIKKYFVLK